MRCEFHGAKSCCGTPRMDHTDTDIQLSGSSNEKKQTKICSSIRSLVWLYAFNLAAGYFFDLVHWTDMIIELPSHSNGVKH
jgi:hypothetical protein